MPRRMAYIPPVETDVPLSNCYLVWLPDNPRYRAAFWGAYSDLAQYWMWDEDDESRREEITASWLAAIAQTLECADMACFEELIAKMEEVRQAVIAAQCCGTYNIVSDSYNTNIVYNQGDAPTTWGDGETVADWEDWAQLVCDQAHQFVDNLIAVAISARETLLAGTLTINAISAWLRHLTFLSLLLDIANTLASTIWSEMLGTGADSWDNVATNLEAARDDIVCAIINGGDVEQLVGDAVGTVAWATFYSRVDYETAVAIMFEGGAAGQYLTPSRNETCVCEESFAEYAWTFDTDNEGWEQWTLATPPVYARAANWYNQGMVPGIIAESGSRMMSPVMNLVAGSAMQVTFKAWSTGQGGMGIFVYNADDMSTFYTVWSITLPATEQASVVTRSVTMTVPAGQYRLSFNAPSGNNSLIDTITFTVTPS